eukprot:246501_1
MESSKMKIASWCMLKLIIALTITCGGIAQSLNNTNDTYVIAREKWVAMNNTQRGNYQTTHHCCNFNTVDDDHCCACDPGYNGVCVCLYQYACYHFLAMNITNNPSSMPTDNPLQYEEKNDTDDQYNAVGIFGFISIGFVFAIFILFVVYLIMRCNGYHFVKNSENVQQTYQLMKDGFL